MSFPISLGIKRELIFLGERSSNALHKNFGANAKKVFFFNSQVTIKIIVIFSEFISYCLYNIFFVSLKSPKKRDKNCCIIKKTLRCLLPSL